SSTSRAGSPMSRRCSPILPSSLRRARDSTSHDHREESKILTGYENTAVSTPAPRTVVIGAGHWHFPLYEPGLVRSTRLVGISAEPFDVARDIALRLRTTPWASWMEMLDQT